MWARSYKRARRRRPGRGLRGPHRRAGDVGGGAGAEGPGPAPADPTARSASGRAGAPAEPELGELGQAAVTGPDRRTPTPGRRSGAAQAARRWRRAKAEGQAAGLEGLGLEMSANPDEVIDHRPQRCEGCGGELDDDASTGFCCPPGDRAARGHKAPSAPAKRWLVASRSESSRCWSASGPVFGSKA